MSFLKNKSNGCIHAADRATIFYLLHKNWNKLVLAWVQVESIENQSNNSRGIKLLGTTWLPSLYPRDAGEIRSQWTIFSTSIAEASRRSCGCKVVSAWISPNQMGDTDSDSVTLSFANKLKKESCSVLSSLWNYRCSWRVPPHQTECILIGSWRKNLCVGRVRWSHGERLSVFLEVILSNCQMGFRICKRCSIHKVYTGSGALLTSNEAVIGRWKDISRNSSIPVKLKQSLGMRGTNRPSGHGEERAEHKCEADNLQSNYVPTVTDGQKRWVVTERIRSQTQAVEMGFLR